MEDTLSLLYVILLFSTVLFFLCASAGLTISLTSKKYEVFKKRLWFLNPTYYLFFSVIVFCLVVVLIMRASFVPVGVYFAIFLLLMLIGGMRIYKLGKSKASFETLKNYAYKKYFCDMLICIALYIVIQSLF
jgi:hypothetical protein